MATGTCEGRQSRIVFDNSVKFVLANWPAVRLAVEQGFAGHCSREKERWLEQVVFNLFLENDIIDALDVEDFLAEILSNEFNILIEDESLPKVSETLCRYYQLCMNGEHSKVTEEIMSVRLPTVMNIRCNEEVAVNDGVHNVVSQQLENMNLMEEANVLNEQPTLNTNEQEMNTYSEEMEDTTDENEGAWVVVQRSKKKR